MTQDAVPNVPPAPQAPLALTWRGAVVIILAFIFLMCSLCAALFYLVSPIVARRTDDISDNVIFGSMALLGGVFGVITLWQGINVGRGRASGAAARAFPPVIVLAMLLVAALILGTLTLALKTLAAWLFPVWHFIAASCIPLIFLAYAAHRLGQTSDFRTLFTTVGWGTWGVTPIVLAIEFAVGTLCFLLIAIIWIFDPQTRALFDALDPSTWLERDPVNLARTIQILLHPLVLGIVLLYFAVIVPLIEETFKTLIIAFGDPARLTRARAMLWGIGAGAGFALIENIVNTGALQIAWAFAMLLRIGATTMHIVNGAIMGRGWYAARVERRWDQLGIAFVISVLGHGIWNALSIALGASLVYALNMHAFDIANWRQPITGLVGALSIGLLIGLMVLAFSGMAWFVAIVQTVREPPV